MGNGDVRRYAGAFPCPHPVPGQCLSLHRALPGQDAYLRGLQRVGNHIRALASTRQELPGDGGRWPSAAASASCQQHLQSTAGPGPRRPGCRAQTQDHSRLVHVSPTLLTPTCLHFSLHTSARLPAGTASTCGSRPFCLPREVTVPVPGRWLTSPGHPSAQALGALQGPVSFIALSPTSKHVTCASSTMQKDVRAKAHDLRSQSWGRIPGYCSLGGGLSIPICKVGSSTRLGR